ncbi:uncharacterized protein [Nicotiana tomentosiformis]|uniref:uncharacterized protein n=1 Tax=Nicotiana tomentosiformis TaxID=4098 RepID=UPI00388C91A5
MRDCPTRHDASIAQLAGSVAGLSSSVRPPGQGSQAPISRGRGRGGAFSSSGPHNRIYALVGRQDQESSPYVVTGILSVFSYDVYALIDPGSTLSYVTLLVASKFGIKLEYIKPFEVSTPVGDSIIAKRVYKGCIIVAHSRSTVADLIELDMVEFDVIMGMDWLASCHANVDCRSKIVRFQFLREPVLEWKVSRCFPNELSGLLPEREIEFAIDLLPHTHPISIPPYRMALSELKELKEQLKDLLEKGFIRPSTSPWKSPVLFVKKKDAFLKHVISSEGIRVDTQKIEAVKTCPRPATPTEPEKRGIVHELHQLASLGVRLLDSSDIGITIQDTATSSLVTEVKERQYEDPVLVHYRDSTLQKEKTPFEITEDGVLRYRGRLCVPIVAGLHRQDTSISSLVTEVKERQYEDPVLVHHKDTTPQKEKTPFEITEDGVLRYRGRLCVPNVARLRRQVDDWVFLKVSPMKDVMRFRKKGKLSPQYIGPYKIICKVDQVAYELDLPSHLESVHPVFHVSMLRKCIGDPSRVLSVDDVQVTEQLSYEETPIAILDRQVMGETHYSRYSIHPRATKMYHDIREVYWWDGMKKDIAEFVAQCPNCQQVKIEHQKPSGILQAMEIPTWKWEVINMDFIVGLPRTQYKFDSIWVIVDRLTKSAHFLPVRTTYSAKDYARLYIKEVVRLHGVPVPIISDRRAQFIANFWRSFQKGLGTQGSWDDHLSLIEFTYNNSYHSSIQMAPYEALYGRKCRSPIGWFDVEETKLVRLELVQEAIEKIKLIQERLLAAQSRQKSYADNRRRDLEFQVDYWVFLKISPIKGIMKVLHLLVSFVSYGSCQKERRDSLDIPEPILLTILLTHVNCGKSRNDRSK